MSKTQLDIEVPSYFKYGQLPALNDYVRQYCAKNNISLEKLAKYAGLSRGSLYKLLDDSTMPTIKPIVKLASAMQAHPQYLLKLKWASCRLCDTTSKPIKPKKQKTQKHVTDATAFIDETIPDGSMVATGSEFTKIWTIQNTGECIWENRFLMCVDNNDSFKHPAGLNIQDYRLKPHTEVIDIPKTLPGESVSLSVSFSAPPIPAHAISYWKMIDEHGSFCFPDAIGLYVTVRMISGGLVNGAHHIQKA